MYESKGKIWTNKEIEFLRDNLDTPIDEIASQLNRTPSAVVKKYSDMKIPRKQSQVGMNFFKLTEKEKSFLKENYDNMTRSELAYHLNRSYPSIQYHLQQLNLKKTVTDFVSYFDKECSEQYAYILGWLFSDGSIQPNCYVALSILKPDGLFLKPYMLDIYPWTMRYYIPPSSTKEQLSFRCSSRSVAQFLTDKWQLHKKSRFLSDSLYDYISINEDFKKCFLRGVFEGDGTIGKTLDVRIAARIDFDWVSLTRLLPDNIPYSIRKLEKSYGCWSNLEFGRYTPLFLDYIYSSNFEAALPRKKEKAVYLARKRTKKREILNQCSFYLEDQ